MKNMKKKIKENKSTVIFVGVVIVLLVGVFVLAGSTNKSYIEKITFSEYEEIVEKSGTNYVYVGDYTSVKSVLNSFGKERDTTVYYLETDGLSEANLKELEYENDTFSTYLDGKEISVNDIKLTEITVDEYLELVKAEGNHFMFIGSSSCGYCTKFKEEIKKVQVLYDFDFYYLDLASITDDEYTKLTESDSYFTEEEWGTPLNFLYIDGKKVDVLSGYVPSDDLIEFLDNNGAL